MIVASRGSRLAMRQAEMVANLVRSLHPSVSIEIVTVTTTGDKDARPFHAIGGKGLFTAEVERELVERRADIAVHSAKDLTAELFEGCGIVCVPKRASVADVVVGGVGSSGEERLARLAPGARVGTSSIRRRALLAEVRPDVDVVDLRGNLDTRLRKVAVKEVDAAIVAAAGIERLEGDGSPAGALDPNRWVPPPGQGALAVEALIEREDIAGLFAGLSDPAAERELAFERAFAAALEGGCTVPLGCLARVTGEQLVATAFLGHPEGGEALRDRISGPARAAETLGAELAQAILDAGGGEMLADLQEIAMPPPSPP